MLFVLLRFIPSITKKRKKIGYYLFLRLKERYHKRDIHWKHSRERTLLEVFNGE